MSCRRHPPPYDAYYEDVVQCRRRSDCDNLGAIPRQRDSRASGLGLESKTAGGSGIVAFTFVLMSASGIQADSTDRHLCISHVHGPPSHQATAGTASDPHGEHHPTSSLLIAGSNLRPSGNPLSDSIVPVFSEAIFFFPPFFLRLIP